MIEIASQRQDFTADLARVAGIAAVPTILDVICRTTGMGFAAVARVTEDRWIACAVKDDIGFGLKPGGELEVQTTICDEIRASGVGVVIDHVAEDANFVDHHTPKMYGIQSYISIPIIRPSNGQFFGTLCAIDPRPARLRTPEVIGMFELFANLIGFHLDAQDSLTETHAALLDARQSAELREQFIAVLGHDLRNPLASIDAGARMLKKTPLDEKSVTILNLMQTSVQRMAGLIDNVLDFARGRLGGGLSVEHRSAPDLHTVVEQVAAELRLSQPDRLIQLDIKLDQTVVGDSMRLGQMFSNLLANALTHGAPDQPVRVRVASGEGVFEMTVANAGPPIPQETRKRLFQPFARGAGPTPGSQGLGLGLYISSEIARAHGGTLEMASDDGETFFTFRMPLPTA